MCKHWGSFLSHCTLGPGDQKLLDAWVKEQLKKGYIRQSKSPQASGFFFVQKKDAKKKRPCQDYQYLNRWTKLNAYPIPLISNLMLKLKGSWYFMKLDIQWGYNNVRLKQGDEWKATFITNRGLFEPTVMFFGLMNSPMTFQAMMDDYFEDLITVLFTWLELVRKNWKKARWKEIGITRRVLGQMTSVLVL